MELEFDKEMDAILRKARGSAGVETVSTPHVDVDSIAAFAENALPEKAKQRCIEHFADCRQCRKLLSRAILSAVDAAPVAAPSVAAVAVPAAVIPWYERLIRPPAIALMMGAIVLTFTGFLGYLVIERGAERTRSDVALVSEKKERVSGPNAEAEATPISANTNAASTAPANTASAANSVGNSAYSANVPTSRTNGPSAEAPAAAGTSETRRDNESTSDVAGDAPKPVAAAPPPPKEQPAPAATERKTEPSKFKDDAGRNAMAKTDQVADDRTGLALNTNASKKAGGPRNVQVQQQQESVIVTDGSVAAEKLARRRTAGGKVFERSGPVWYDTSYRGGSTRNIARGSAEYKKLDPGLRSIADSIGGTVVIVWKEVPYRIH